MLAQNIWKSWFRYIWSVNSAKWLTKPTFSHISNQHFPRTNYYRWGNCFNIILDIIYLISRCNSRWIGNKIFLRYNISIKVFLPIYRYLLHKYEAYVYISFATYCLLFSFGQSIVQITFTSPHNCIWLCEICLYVPYCS